MIDYALILASGTGSRAGGDLPKQFRMVAGRPLLMWTLLAFSGVKDLRLILVLHPDYVSYWLNLMAEFPSNLRLGCQIVTGGASRIESVRKGLAAVAADDAFSPESLVCVHDGARPLVTPEIISRGLSSAHGHKAVAVPVVPVTDSLRELSPDADSSEPVDRSRFVAVQTPQIAPFSWLDDAYSREMLPSFTDDASILQTAGYPVTLYEGSPDNLKVTNPSDFIIAEALLESRRPR